MNIPRVNSGAHWYEMLQAAFQRALEGSGQVVGIVGEPGVGKSRLCFEFARSSDVANCEILDTGGVSYRRGAASPGPYRTCEVAFRRGRG